LPLSQLLLLLLAGWVAIARCRFARCRRLLVDARLPRRCRCCQFAQLLSLLPVVIASVARFVCLLLAVCHYVATAQVAGLPAN
jgi:hypothetical protein